MTYAEIMKIMEDYNKEKGYTTKGQPHGDLIHAVVVISADSFQQSYTLEERSYRFSNDNKRFYPNQCSNSIFADCLDGKDLGVRLDYYIPGARWKVEDAYMEW